MTTSGSHSKRQKHHYIPEFYLKQWASPNKNGEMKLCEFCRRHKGVMPRSTSPGGTGYEENLYTLSGFPPDRAQSLEDVFFKTTDQLANDALQNLLGHNADMSMEMRSGWSRFILSLIHRNPEKVAWVKGRVQRELAAQNTTTQELRESYQRFRSPSDPPSFDEWMALKGDSMGERAFASLLQTMVDSTNVGTYLNGMIWGVLSHKQPVYSLLTSDRPVVMTDGIRYDNSYILIPISPNSVFLAVNTPQQKQYLFDISFAKIVGHVNDVICKQAKKYVYSTDDRQLRFVANRLGRGTPQFIAGKRP